MENLAQDVATEVEIVNLPTLPSLFEIVQYKIGELEDIPLPEAPHYLLASEGIYLRYKNLFGIYVVPLDDNIQGLKELGKYDKGYFQYNGPKLPVEILGKAVDFFRKVYKEFKGAEAEVLLIYKEDESKFDLFVPEQRVSSTSVNSKYEPEDIPTGWQVVGSMHSHGSMGAFHSGTDTDDASDGFNGLHITVGHISQETPEFACMVAVNARLFNFKVESVADTSGVGKYNSPDEWMKKVTQFYSPPKTGQSPNVVRYPNSGWRGDEKLPGEIWVNGKRTSRKKKWNGSSYDPWWYSKNKWDDEDDDDIRWSYEFGCYVPANWIDNKKQQIADEHLEDAIDKVLSLIEKSARKRGITVVWAVAPVEDIKLLTEVIEVIKEETAKVEEKKQ